jgi:photosystem II stability/assembly factor-like uncharacterized protein
VLPGVVGGNNHPQTEVWILNPGTLYYWRVRTREGATDNYGPWSELGRFHTYGPPQGSVWVSKSTGSSNNHAALHFPTAQVGYLVGEQGAILASSDGGESWVSQSGGVSSTLRAVRFTDEMRGWIAGDSGVILFTSNGGAVWDSQSTGTTKGLYALSAVDTSIVYAGGEGGVLLRTTDGGEHWDELASPTTRNLVDVRFESHTKGYLVTITGAVFTTENEGVTWSGSSVELIENQSAYQYVQRVHYSSSEVGYAWISYSIKGCAHNCPTPGTELLKTTNAGAVWIDRFHPNQWSVSALYFWNNQIGYLARSDSRGLYKTLDGGVNWSIDVAPEENVNAIFCGEAWEYCAAVGQNGYFLKLVPH